MRWGIYLAIFCVSQFIFGSSFAQSVFGHTHISGFYAPKIVTGMIAINDGAPMTNDPQGYVILKIQAVGAAEMCISNNGSFVGARWEAYDVRKQWRLIADVDGLKTVYARFRNATKDEVSEVAVAEILLDRQPPTDGWININNGAEFTNVADRKVNLTLNAVDAKEMRVSNRADFMSARWLPYTADITGWYLTGQDGVKRVYAQFRDIALNMTPVVSDTIMLDRMPPLNPKIRINSDELYTQKAEVKLQLYCEGAKEYKIKGQENWEVYAPEVKHTIPSNETGEKAVYVIFKDAVGNVSRPVFDKIILDVTPPQSPKVLIASGNKYTKTADVDLKVSAPGASEIMVSNSPIFDGGKWQSMPPSFILPVWTFSLDEGVKKVYVKFRDQAGNESEVASDDIILDRSAPTNTSIKISTKDGGIDAVTRDTLGRVNLKILAQDARYMMISNSSTFYDAKWEIYRDTISDWQLSSDMDAEKYVYAKFRDKAGNVSQPVFDKIVLDRQPPVDLRIQINNGATYTNRDTVTLSLGARGAHDMKITNGTDFSNAKWQPFTTEVRGWQIEGRNNDTLKISVIYRDLAQNESKPIVGRIIKDTQAPYDCELTINRGDTITNQPNKVVILGPKARGADFMMLSNSSDFSSARWQRYSDVNMSYILAGEDGQKTVYIKYKDNAGNISEVKTATIKLDRQPPYEGKVTINDGDKGTNVQEVTITLEAKDAVSMQVTNDYTFQEVKDWEPYKTQKKHVLVGNNGVKTVYARFKDKAGNVSKVAAARIGFDTNAPRDGRIFVNRGAKYCTNINGYVEIFTETLDATFMKISNTSNFDSAQWKPYQILVSDWPLGGDDGPKVVHIKFKDDVGNESNPIRDSIYLDRQEPFGEEIAINNGERFTNKNVVTLRLTVEGATQMMISNTRNFVSPAKWEPYTEAKLWPLISTEGEKTVYAKFRDDAGNTSYVAASTIMLDSRPPSPGVVKLNNGQPLTKKAEVSVQLNANEATEMMVSTSSTFEGANWQEYQAKFNYSFTETVGFKRLFVKFRDACKNETKAIFGDVTLESE